MQRTINTCLFLSGSYCLSGKPWLTPRLPATVVSQPHFWPSGRNIVPQGLSGPCVCYLQNELGARHREVRNPEKPCLGSLHSTQILEINWHASHWELLPRQDVSPYYFSWLIYLFLEVSANGEGKLQLAPRSHQDFGLKKNHLNLLRIVCKRREEKSLFWCVCVKYAALRPKRLDANK